MAFLSAMFLFFSSGLDLLFRSPAMLCLDFDEVMIDGECVFEVIGHTTEVDRTTELIVNRSEEQFSSSGIDVQSLKEFTDTLGIDAARICNTLIENLYSVISQYSPV